MKKNSRLSIYVCTSLGIILACLSLIAFWLLYPYKPFTFFTERNIMVQHEYRAGDYVQWYVDVEHHTNGALVSVDRQLVDGVVINYPTVQFVTDGTRQKFINTSMRIPDYVPAGTYHIEIASTVPVNPLRSITVVRRTEDFKIVK